MNAKSFPHLPPGHEPGRQSLRNRKGAPLLWWFVGLVGTGMFLAGLFVAAGGRGPRFDRREELFGGIFFGAMGLLCALVAVGQYRKFRPVQLRSRLRGLHLAVDGDESRRGDKITATVSLHRPAEALEVGLVCVESYDLLTRAQTKAGMITVRQTNRANAYEYWQEVEPVAGEQTIAFEIPGSGPYSYEGDCVSYAWRVSARLVRRLRADPRLDQPIWVRA